MSIVKACPGEGAGFEKWRLGHMESHGNQRYCTTSVRSIMGWMVQAMW
jgi:hypothetical protein